MGNAERVANAFVSNSEAGIPLNDTDYASDLTSLRLAIESASRDTLSDPDSECRQSMKLLATFAADPGPMGAPAREALRDLYEKPPEGMDAEVRAQLLNTALEVCESCDGKSATVLYMAGRSADPPDGNSGAGVRQNIGKALSLKLGAGFEREPDLDLLAADRVPSNTELQAAADKLKNLNWGKRVSIAKPDAAKQGFERMLSDVAVHQKTVTVWVEGANGHCVPVVAQPLPSGEIRFHVIAQNEAGEEVGKQLSELSGDDCVITHKVEDTYLTLKHVNANVDHDSGVGGAIRAHIDATKNMNADKREAVKLVAQTEMFEAASGTRAALPASPPHAKSLEDNFNTQGLTVRSGRVHSGIDGIAEIFSLKEAIELAPKDAQLMMTYMTKLNVQQAAPERQNFFGPALAFVNGFNEGKAPLLFKNVDPSGPLASISKTLHGVDSGKKIIDLMVKHQQTLLQECRDAKDLSQLKNKLEKVVEAQAKLLGGINTAIADLEKFESEDLTSLNPEIAAQAKAQAKDLLAVSKRYRECLTGENSAQGNVYADFVAFAKQATTFGPSLEAAQAMFKGIGSKARTVPTPPVALQRPPPEIFVKLPPEVTGAMQVNAPLQPMQASPAPATRAEMKTLASAMGFFKDDIGQATNIWEEVAHIANVGTGLRGAGFLKRRRLTEEVERRLNKVPESHKRFATALMKATAVPSTLAKSPLWAHLNKNRDADRARRAEEHRKEAPSEGVGSLDKVAASILEQSALAVDALAAQLLIRLQMLSSDLAKHAAYVTSNNPDDAKYIMFKKQVTETESYLQGLGKWIDDGIDELNAVLTSVDGGVTEKVKADAKTMRDALDILHATFNDPKGIPQYFFNFTKAALASPDNLKQAADALIV
jgi:hypothetical protein